MLKEKEEALLKQSASALKKFATQYVIEGREEYDQQTFLNVLRYLLKSRLFFGLAYCLIVDLIFETCHVFSRICHYEDPSELPRICF